MRHRKKRHHLGKAADQRKALLRSLATSFLTHDQITTTLSRAKAVQPEVEKILTLAKRGDLQAIRQINRKIYNQSTGEMMNDSNTGKEIDKTVLRRVVRELGPKFADRKGGYTRIVHAPPRRGDAAPMAILELVD
jgi:large subunit ribosomal protein L17